MKHFFILSLIILSYNIGLCQREGCFDYTLNFEEDYCIDQLSIDNISDSNNIWQIGHPQKTVLNVAKEGLKVIITDTSQVYPVRDTSFFIVKNPATGGGFVWPHTAGLHGYYWANSDTLNDYGTIEFSPDNGTTWINLITDTVYSDSYYWSGAKPSLTGNSSGWQKFDISLSQLGNIFEIDYTDTVQYRFTFITDSIQDSLGGLIYDQLYFSDLAEGIDDLNGNSFELNISPNPGHDFIQITTTSDSKSISQHRIFDLKGTLMRSAYYDNAQSIRLNTIDLDSGIYLIELTESDSNLKKIKRFIVLK